MFLFAYTVAFTCVVDDYDEWDEEFLVFVSSRADFVSAAKSPNFCV